MQSSTAEAPPPSNPANVPARTRATADVARSLAGWLLQNWLLVAGLALAVHIRVLLIPVLLNPDYDGSLVPWYQQTVAAGRVRSLGLAISNYAPAYMYCLALVSALPFKMVVNIKLIPLVFDVVAAIATYKLVRIGHPRGSLPALAAGWFLLCPTVLLNGAMWAQCDVMYVGFLLFALGAALLDRPLAAVLFFSLGVAVKLQAMFFLPALGLIFLKKRFSPLYFALTPTAYVLLAIPPALLGRPFGEVLGIYFTHYGHDTLLAVNASSVYNWIPVATAFGAQSKGAIAFAAAICLLSGHVLLKLGRGWRTRDYINAALFLTALVPFVLPKMHERYAFTSDVLACVVPFFTPSLTVPSLLLISASFISYGPYMSHPWMPLSYAAILNLIGLVWIARQLGRDLGITEQFLAAEPHP